MDEMIELLKQIQELAGVGIDALKGAKGGGPQEKGGPDGGDGAPSEAPPEAGAPGPRQG